MVNPKTLSLAIVILLLNIAQVGAEGLSVDVDLHEVRAGEPADISASISVPDLPGSHEAELTTKLYVDGEQVSSKKITVRDGETTSASFTHTFSQGSHNVKVECAVSLGGTSISGSRSISVDIKPEVTSTPEPEVLETPEKVKITTEGAAFALPETLKDDVSSYIDKAKAALERLPVETPTEAFLLANNENTFLVIASQSDKGMASVEGWKLSKNATLAGTEVGVIVADRVSFNKEGDPASVSDILSNPQEYNLELVEVTATRRHVSILYDPDEGAGVEFPLTIGYLTENPLTIRSVVKEGIDKVEEVVREGERDTIRNALKPGEKRLPVFDFETGYWVNCRAETNGIVLSPQNKIAKILEKSVPVHLISETRPTLYDVKTDLKHTQVGSVDEIKRNLNQYMDKVVSVEAKGFGDTISVQETLEHSTDCGEDKIPVKDECINLVLDDLLEGGVAWNKISLDNPRESLIATAGVSSRHQDEPLGSYNGNYMYIGRVMSLKQVNESLEGTVLVIYHRERTGDINYEEVGESARKEIEDRVENIKSALSGFTETSAQITEQVKEEEAITPTTTTTTTTPKEKETKAKATHAPATPTPTEGAISPETPGFEVLLVIAGLLVALALRFKA